MIKLLVLRIKYSTSVNKELYSTCVFVDISCMVIQSLYELNQLFDYSMSNDAEQNEHGMACHVGQKANKISALH